MRTLPIPWIIAALTVVILIVVIAYVAGRSTSPPGARSGAGRGTSPPSAGGDAAAPGRAPDISNMTPRQQADRLFDLIMTAHEQGDTERVGFLSPMTLQAYALIGELDLDARYHMGLIHAITGTPQAALAQADSMERSSPDHLLATMLRATVARARGNPDAAQEAYRRFLDNYEREMASGRPEYDAHRVAIDLFREQALESTSGGA